MKKPSILNRPMFNRGGTSAYGRGITSNLVSDEQRQRFNYGGRVGYLNAGSVNQTGFTLPKVPGLEYEEIVDVDTIPTSNVSSTVSNQTDDDIPNEWDSLVEGVEVEELVPGPYFPGHFRKKKEKAEAYEKSMEEAQKRMYPTEPYEGRERKNITNPGAAGTGDMPDSDTIDWEEFAEGLYNKKTGRGKALLELAGNVLAASQQPKKEAAAIVGKGVGQFGKTWSERQEKMEDIAATGKMYEQVNIAKAKEAGEWAVKAAMVKAGLAGDAFRVFQDSVGKGLGADKSLFRATGVQTQELKKGKDDQVVLPGDAQPGQVFRTGKIYYVADQDGNLSEPTTDIRIVIGLIKSSRL